MKSVMLVGAVVAPLVLAGGPAHAFLGISKEFNISTFCEVSAPRQTIVYVDDSILIEGQHQWAERLYAKLVANLMPSEPVAVVRLSPGTGRAEEVWKACYPDYTDEQKAGMKGFFTNFFDKPPLKVLESQQGVFRQQLGVALGKVLSEASRPPAKVQIDPDRPPRKQLIRAIVADEARFDRTRGDIRVIIYSDMIENSDLGVAWRSSDQDAHNAASRLGLNLQNAVIYAYGVGASLSQRDSGIDNAKMFWDSFFRSAGAHLAGFGSDLVVTTGAPVAKADYEIEVATPGEPRIGRIHLFVDHEGRLQDSYILLGTRGRSLLTEGTFLCKGGSTCRLDAKAPSPVLTVEGNEEIKLSGPRDALKGTIGVAGGKLPDGTAAVFPIVARLAP